MNIDSTCDAICVRLGMTILKFAAVRHYYPHYNQENRLLKYGRKRRRDIARISKAPIIFTSSERVTMPTSYLKAERLCKYSAAKTHERVADFYYDGGQDAANLYNFSNI